MSLEDFVIQTEEVAFQGGSLSVRGLSLNDISYLTKDYLAELTRLFALYEPDDKKDAQEKQAQAVSESLKFAMTIFREAPELVAEIIVRAGDLDREKWLQKATRLPLAIQIEAIRRVIEVTFEEAGGAKKFAGSLLMMFRTIQPTHFSTD